MMLVGCICNDYTIEIDKKKCKIKGEKLVGSFSPSMTDPDFSESDIYFTGAVFIPGKDGAYKMEGTVELTKREFYDRVSSYYEIF